MVSTGKILVACLQVNEFYIFFFFQYFEVQKIHDVPLKKSNLYVTERVITIWATVFIAFLKHFDDL